MFNYNSIKFIDMTLISSSKRIASITSDQNIWLIKQDNIIEIIDELWKEKF